MISLVNDYTWHRMGVIYLKKITLNFAKYVSFFSEISNEKDISLIYQILDKEHIDNVASVAFKDRNP